MISAIFAAAALVGDPIPRTVTCFMRSVNIYATNSTEYTIWTPGNWVQGTGSAVSTGFFSTFDVQGSGLPLVEPCVPENDSFIAPQSKSDGGTLLPGSYSTHVFIDEYPNMYGWLGTWAASEVAIDEGMVYGKFRINETEYVDHAPFADPIRECEFGGTTSLFGFGRGVSNGSRQATEEIHYEFTIRLIAAILVGDNWPSVCEERSTANYTQFFHSRVLIRDVIDEVEHDVVVFDGLVIADSTGAFTRLGGFADEEFEPFGSADDLQIDGTLVVPYVTDSSEEGVTSTLSTIVQPSSGSGKPGDPLGNENVDGDEEGQICWSDRLVLLSRLGTEIGDLEYSVLGDLDLDADIDNDDVLLFNQVPCNADWHCDGVVDIVDFLDFFDAYGNEDPAADMNGDTVIDVSDQLDFYDAYAAGC